MSQFGGGEVPPWYKENPFWGGISGFSAFIIAGVGFGVTEHLTLGRWLLVASWPFGVMAIWIALNGVTDNRTIRIGGRIAAILGLGLVLALSAVWMGKPTAPIVAVESEDDHPPPAHPSSGPTDNIKASDSIAVEVRRAKPPVEFSFQTSGEKKQRITSSVFPTVIELEPAPTGVQDADLPKDVAVNGGTVTVLRFGQGYMMFDTHAVPVGTAIRGRIISYSERGR